MASPQLHRKHRLPRLPPSGHASRSKPRCSLPFLRSTGARQHGLHPAGRQREKRRHADHSRVAQALLRGIRHTFGEVPRPINLEAPAGTIMLMDGRVLHGGAVNHSDDLRYIITNSVVRPFIRQQESFHLTIRPEVLRRASDKFLWRCGFQATGARSMVEGYGYFGSGRLGDANGTRWFTPDTLWTREPTSTLAS